MESDPKGPAKAPKSDEERIFTALRKVLVNKNPATFDVDQEAYDSPDLGWDGSFDTTSNPPVEDQLQQYTAESGFAIGDGKQLDVATINKNNNSTWTLTIQVNSDINPLVWQGTKAATDNPNTASGSYTREDGTDQTQTLQIGSWQ